MNTNDYFLINNDAFFATTKHVKKIHACRDINTKIIKHANTKMIISKYCVMLFF